MSGDIRSGIPGTGGAGYDIYTRFPPGGVTPPPPSDNLMILENGDFMVMENGTDYMQME